MYGLMSHACTPILVGIGSPLSKILVLSKTANFPFQSMDLVHGHHKILIDWNWLKKIMHVGIDVTCIHANFGGCSLSGFGDIATFAFL